MEISPVTSHSSWNGSDENGTSFPIETKSSYLKSADRRYSARSTFKTDSRQFCEEKRFRNFDKSDARKMENSNANGKADVADKTVEVQESNQNISKEQCRDVNYNKFEHSNSNPTNLMEVDYCKFENLLSFERTNLENDGSSKILSAVSSSRDQSSAQKNFPNKTVTQDDSSSVLAEAKGNATSSLSIGNSK